MFDVVNTTKYHIMAAIECLEYRGEVPNLYSVRQATGLRTTQIAEQLKRLREDLLIAKHDPKRTHGCTLKYKLSKQGRDILEKYHERHEKGYNLRLREVPKKMDWSGFSFLPGIEMDDDDDSSTEAEA